MHPLPGCSDWISDSNRDSKVIHRTWFDPWLNSLSTLQACNQQIWTNTVTNSSFPMLVHWEICLSQEIATYQYDLQENMWQSRHSSSLSHFFSPRHHVWYLTQQVIRLQEIYAKIFSSIIYSRHMTVQKGKSMQDYCEQIPSQCSEKEQKDNEEQAILVWCACSSCSSKPHACFMLSKIGTSVPQLRN